MPIDIDQLKFLVKSAGQVPDKATQAMTAAAQTAKPAGGIPLPKEIKEESPAEGALSAEQQQREQEKLEQQRRKELESKENEIRGLKHELELERVEREKMTNQHALDEKVRQEEAKLKAERDKLEQDRFQLVQEKARQDNMFKAEEMRHQATLDKATYKQEAEIAKAQAKSMSDIAKQQAQTLIANNDKARKASDKYYADASARLNKEHPSISPALQSQLDGAIASLGRFSKVHKKQMALPKPGTPPDLTKLAMIKWAADDNPTGVLARNAPTTGATQTSNAGATTSARAADGGPSGLYDYDAYKAHMDESYKARAAERMNRKMRQDMISRGAIEGGNAYDAQRAAAYYSNQLAMAKDDNDTARQKYYEKLLNRTKAMASTNLGYSRRLGRKSDIASYKSYTHRHTNVNDWSSHKKRYTAESQYDRDANAYSDARAAHKHQAAGGGTWYQKAWDATLGGTYQGAFNAVSDMNANMDNANYFGANRFWNTTFDDNSMADAYYNSINNHNFSDSFGKDVGMIGLNTVLMPALDAWTIASLASIPVTGPAGAASAAGSTALKTALKGGAKAAMGAGFRTGAKNVMSTAANQGVGAAAKLMGRNTLNYAAAHPWMTAGWGAYGGTTAYNAATHTYENPYTSNIDPSVDSIDMVKFSSANLPMPGEAPMRVKRANLFTAQTANNYYDGFNLNNESYYKPVFSGLGKTLSGLVSNLTGGLINPYKAITKYDIYRAPAPASSRDLMTRVVNEADSQGNSNIHKVVANAAEAKHSPKRWGNTNGTLQHPSVSGRIFNNQLAQTLA